MLTLDTVIDSVPFLTDTNVALSPFLPVESVPSLAVTETPVPDHLHDIIPILAAPNQSPVILVALALGMLCFLYVIISRQKLLAHMTHDFFLLKAHDTFFTEETSHSLNTFSLSCLLLFVLSTGTIIYDLIFPMLHEEPFNVNFIVPAVCYATSAAFVAFHFVSLRYLSFVFAHGLSVASLFRKVYFSALLGSSLAFFPIAIALTFGSHFLQSLAIPAALIVAVLYFFLLIYQTCKIFLHSLGATFFIVLYLCALEFLPLLVLAKWISQY